MRVLVLPLFIFITHLAIAQDFVAIDSIQELQIAAVHNHFHPVISNDGNYVAVRSYSKHGLLLFNVASEKLDTIAEESVFVKDVMFDEQSSLIYYTQKDKAGKNSVKSYDFVTASQSDSRFWRWLTDLWSSAEKEDDQLPDPVLLSNHRLNYPCLSVKKDSIFYHLSNTQYRSLKPLNVNYFLRPALSPDGKQIVAEAYGKGTFVCNIEGDDVKMIDQIEAPSWLSDDVLIGMISRDDGHEVKSSAIVAYHRPSGNYQILVPYTRLAQYPQYNVHCHKIICHSLNGKVFIIHLAG